MKVAAYVAGLAVVFGAALGAGVLVGPDSVAEDAGHGGGQMSTEHTAGHAEPAEAGHPAQAAGLAVSADGYTLQLLGGSQAGTLDFRILDHTGDPVRDFEIQHEKKKLHLIVVNRDLSGFRHVHPVLAADGTWSVPMPIENPGAYRVIADFKAAGAAAGTVLGADLLIPGDSRITPLPAPSTVAVVDGYRVELSTHLTAGGSAPVTLTVSKDGRPVTDLEPYLGAYGHLVALRSGDAGYLHVHPTSTTPGPEIRFEAEVPSAGSYRLYLDFQHAGVVHTAEFTVIAGGAP